MSLIVHKQRIAVASSWTEDEIRNRNTIVPWLCACDTLGNSMIHYSVALHVIDSITVTVTKKITESPPTITSVVKTAPGNRKEKKLNCGSCSSPQFSDYWELSCLNNELQIPSSFVHDVVSMDLCVRRLFKCNHCNIHRLVVLPKYSPIYSFLLIHNFYLPFRPRTSQCDVERWAPVCC